MVARAPYCEQVSSSAAIVLRHPHTERPARKERLSARLTVRRSIVLALQPL